MDFKAVAKKDNMLSDEEEQEMKEDAQSRARREAFANARRQVLDQPVSWARYFQFLQSVQHLFPQPSSPKVIQGNMFRL